MARQVIVAVLSSVVSCVLTLSAVSSGLVAAPPVHAQAPAVIQAEGFEVVDQFGNRVAYFGQAQAAPILLLGERGQVVISPRSIREDRPFIHLNNADGTLLWTAP